MLSTTAHKLKALGHKPNISLNELDGHFVDEEEEYKFSSCSCLTPNFPDMEIISSSLDDLENAFNVDEETCFHIKNMHERLYASLGSGSWPGGNKCHPNHYPHKNFHATKIYVDHDDFMDNPSLDREVTDEEWQTVVVDARVWPSVERPVSSVEEAKRIFVYADTETGAIRATRVNKKIGDTLNCLDMGLWLAFEATRRVGVYLIEMFDGPDGDHNIHNRTYPMPGSLSGLGYFPDGTCNDHVTCNIDSLNRYTLGRFTGLKTHELGHCIKFYHEFSSPQSGHRSIMSYAQDNTPFQGYRRAGAPYQYVEDHSWVAARRYFGGEAARPIVETPDDPEPNRLELDLDIDMIDDLPVIRNEFSVLGREFIIVPKPVL
jgi:hypothetical protein